MENGRILIVEDDNDIRTMLTIFFKGQHFQVDAVDNGEDGLKLCYQSAPDLVILDIMLPGIDGYEVCKQLRSTIRTRHIPIIFLTQRDQVEDQIEGLSVGADHYIPKPFDIEVLGVTVQTVIRVYRNLNMLHPLTGLPSDRLISEELQLLLRRQDWAYIELSLENNDVFQNAYGAQSLEEATRLLGEILGEKLGQIGTRDDFIGHRIDHTFTLVSYANKANQIIQESRERFYNALLNHLEQSNLDIQPTNPDTPAQSLPILAIGIVTHQDGVYSNVQEVITVAKELRFLESVSANYSYWGGKPEMRLWHEKISTWKIVGMRLRYISPPNIDEARRRELLGLLVETFTQIRALYGHERDQLFYLKDGRFILVTHSNHVQNLEETITQLFAQNLDELKSSEMNASSELEPGNISLDVHLLDGQKERIGELENLISILFKDGVNGLSDGIDFADADEMNALNNTDWIRFRYYLERHFNKNEFQLMCFELGIDAEDFLDANKADRSRKIIEYCQRHVMTSQLIAYCQKVRPALRWSNFRPI